MDYVIHYDIFSGIVCLIMIIANVSMPFKNHKLRRLYIEMLVVVFLACIFDCASSVMLMNPQNDRVYDSILYICTFAFYVIHTVAPFLVCLYLFYCIRGTRLHIKNYVFMAFPAIVCEVLIILNPFFGWCFTIENGIYRRGNLLFINYVVMCIYIVSVLILYIVYHKKLPIEVRVVMIVYVVACSSTMLIQLFFPKYLVECAGMTCILMVIFYALQSKDMVEEAIKQEAELTRVANAASQAKSDFLMNMSHEICTPINAVMGMNQMILRDSDSPAVSNYSRNIHNACHNLLTIINDIMDFSKLEVGKLSISEEEYYLDSFIREISDEIYPLCNKKKLQYNVTVNPLTPRRLLGDSARIRQCIMNFLTNAVKYTESGYINFSVNYERINAKELLLYFKVEDSGIGIEQEEINKLIFNNSDESIQEEERAFDINGSSLGLNITESILELMNSRIEVSSIVDKGSVFGFSVKQGIADNVSVGDLNFERDDAGDEYSMKETFIAPNAKILVVDDNDMNLQVMRGLLRANELKVVTVGSGEECMLATRKIAFDVIFMDYMMPYLDGKDTLEKIKSDSLNLCRNTPVVVCTTNTATGVRSKLLKKGFDEFLAKPIDYRELENILINLLPQEKLIIR